MMVGLSLQSICIIVYTGKYHRSLIFIAWAQHLDLQCAGNLASIYWCYWSITIIMINCIMYNNEELLYMCNYHEEAEPDASILRTSP